MGIVDWLDKKCYPTFPNKNWDDLIFRQRINGYLTTKSVVLDVGAGAGIVEAMHFRGQVAKICGLDLDARVEKNYNLDEGKLADAEKIPYNNCTFDVVFADNVMEHLDSPAVVFREIYRVLKPGGVLLFKTPNRSHYVPLIARWTPHKFHQVVNKYRGRDSQDTFPTYYLANSEAQVNELANKAGFDLPRIDRIEGRPEYLRMTFVTYLFGIAYERFVNSSNLLSRWRILLIAELHKPEK